MEEIIAEKIERNRCFLEKQVRNEPDNAYAVYQYALTMRLISGMEEQAHEYYQQAIELPDTNASVQASSYLQLVIKSYNILLDPDSPARYYKIIGSLYTKTEDMKNVI